MCVVCFDFFVFHWAMWNYNWFLWTQGLELYRASYTLITIPHTRQQGISMASKRFLEEDGLKLKLVLPFQQWIPLRSSHFIDKFRNTLVKEGSNVFTFKNDQCFLEGEFHKISFFGYGFMKVSLKFSLMQEIHYAIFSVL